MTHTPTEIEAIAKSLTRIQRRAFSNTYERWGKIRLPTAFPVLHRKGLTISRNSAVLTPLGLAVRDHLQKEQARETE